MNLDSNWKPGSARNHTWVAMDKNGYLGLMFNNGYGWLPATLLEVPNISESLGDLCEYIDDDSKKYINNINKKGDYFIDLYSSWVYKDYENKQKIIEEFNKQLARKFKYSTALIGCRMGMFLFEGLEGYSKGEDYPIGYDGETQMGDYYRFIVPTVFATIEDIPAPLRHYIVVSNTIDFTKDRLLDNNKISEYFTRLYHS